MPTTRTTSSEPLLDAETEITLALQIEAGLLAAEALCTGDRTRLGVGDASDAELQLLVAQGTAARRRFVEANLGLVGLVARACAARTGASEADLFQEGCLGLLTAVDRFDCRRGRRFATYAVFWIRAQVGVATARMLGDLNLPGSRAVQLRQVRGAESALAQSLGRTPSPAETAAALGRSERWTADLLGYRSPQPLAAVTGELDRLPEPSVHGSPEAVLAVLDGSPPPGRELLDQLGPDERRVLELRFGFATGRALSYAAVARSLGVSVTRVRRLEERGLHRLRDVCPRLAS